MKAIPAKEYLSVERPPSRFIPSLEGVRGYAFITVFLVHFHGPNLRPHEFWRYPLFLFMSLGWVAVPIFFALSGYLITRILWASKGREGYFRVFYVRRALRVFPLYYLVLALLAFAAWLQHWHLDSRYLAYGVYLQNFSSTGRIWLLGGAVQLSHFWSLAVEEHFYLLWPIIVWLCPDRKTLLRVCCGVLALCFAVRVCWPLTHWPMTAAYYSTFSRVDGIVGGAMVAIIQQSEQLQNRLLTASRWIVALGLLSLCYRAISFGVSNPIGDNHANVVWMIPLANLVSAAILVLLLSETTVTSRVCSLRPFCALGRLSYPMYVFHDLYLRYFAIDLVRLLNHSMSLALAKLIALSSAFLLTWLLALLAYKFIEEPAMHVKQFVRYGQRATGEQAEKAHENELAVGAIPA